MGVSQNNLRAQDSVELLSYVINQTPILRENIDLPVQGQSIAPIGKLIMGNVAYKNAFLNTVNIIGLTVITRNHWENPWKKFTDKGTLSYGQTVREIMVDIANVYDYNEYVNRPHDFIKTEVPNVLAYMHEVNYQKFYKTTTSDEQMAMAFERGDLFSLIDEIVNSLFEGMEYDYYLVSKYVLARRILDGTVTAIQIENMATKTDREIVAEIKGYSNDMTFRSNKFNPAGIRKATAFENQFAIVSTKFDGKFTTNVLATSYFRSDAEMKANYELADGFGNFDDERMAEIFAKRDDSGNIIPNEYVDGYVPLTDTEKTKLNGIPVVLVDRDFFQMYRYGLDNMAEGRKTEFFNPQTLRTNHWAHIWGVMSSSPYANAICFTVDAQNVTSVTVSPSSATITKGQELQFSSTVETTGFANQSVKWSVNDEAYGKGARINQAGVLKVPANYVSSAGRQGVYVLTIATALASGEEIEVAGVTYTPAEADTTAAAQATALKTALEADETVNATYTITRNSGALTFTEKSGHYGVGAPELVDDELSTGNVTESTTTEGLPTTNSITVTATSIYKDSVSGTATITVA